MNEEDHSANLQLALEVGERELGIRPFTWEKEMSGDQEPEKTTMITYLSKVYELFRGTPLPASGILPPPTHPAGVTHHTSGCGASVDPLHSSPT